MHLHDLSDRPPPRRRAGRARPADRRPRRRRSPAATPPARDTTGSIPTDYRERHPIAIKEGKRTLTLFVGAGRGGLTPMQRAEVLAFAQTWKREATGGITIDRPVGGAERARRARHAEGGAVDPGRGRHAEPRHRHQAVSARTRQAATLRINYPQMAAEAGPCGLWPDDLGPSNDLKHFENQPYYNLGCATQRNLAAMVDEPGRPGAAARRNAGLHRPSAPSASRSGARARARRRPIRTPTRARSAIWANDQTTHCKPSQPEAAPAEPAARDEHIAPAPRVSIQAFCETVETAAAIQSAGEDRRLGKAHLKIQMGGVTAAIEAYRGSPTPNVIMLESEGRGDGILDRPRRAGRVLRRRHPRGRDRPAQRRRALSRAGPPRRQRLPDRAGRHHRRGALDLRPVLRARRQAGRPRHRRGRRQGRRRRLHRRPQHRLGDRRAISRSTRVVTDLDLAFGTAGLDYNQDPPQGIADAVFSPDRIDTAFVDRLLSKCTDHLSLLAAPATLERVYDFGAEAFDAHLRFAARHHALHRARRAAPVDRLDPAHAGQRRRHPDRGGARPRQPAQRQEPVRLPARRAGQRPPPVLLPQPGGRAEAAGDQARRFRQGARGPAGRDHPVRAADCSAPPPTTAR